MVIDTCVNAWAPCQLSTSTKTPTTGICSLLLMPLLAAVWRVPAVAYTQAVRGVADMHCCQCDLLQPNWNSSDSSTPFSSFRWLVCSAFSRLLQALQLVVVYRWGVLGASAVHCPSFDPAELHHEQAGAPSVVLCQPEPAGQWAAAQACQSASQVSNIQRRSQQNSMTVISRARFAETFSFHL